MEADEFQVMFENEKAHWWYVSKRRIIRTLFRKQKNSAILDIGCGTGIVLKELEKYGEVYGLDVSKEAIEFCRERGIKKLRLGSANKLPYKEGTFTHILILDVLDHEAVSERKALREIWRVCKPGAQVFINDVALELLRSRHDDVYHTKHRYTKKEMKALVEKAGFAVERVTYWNLFLFPLILLFRKLDNFLIGSRLKKYELKSNISKTPWLINELLILLLGFEAFLIRYIDLPIGTSVFCVARKK
jgi:SAM-dependent methyltransferase